MIDQRTASWILEFVLRQPIEDWLLNSIFFALPISSSLDPRLKKTLLLRRIASDLSSLDRVTVRTLHCLELIEEIDRTSVPPRDPSDSMRAAYSAVAVDLTARFLNQRSDGGDFFDAVNRIWNSRVSDLERSDAKGLVSARLREERKAMEEAVVNPIFRVDLMGRRTREEALEAVRVYLKEAAEEMGPSLLELAAAAALKGMKTGRGGYEVRMEAGGNDTSNQGGCSTSGFNEDRDQLESRGLQSRNMVEGPGSREQLNQKHVEENEYLMNGKSVHFLDRVAKGLQTQTQGSDIGQNIDHDAVLQSDVITKNPSELKDLENNQNRVGKNARGSVVDKGKIVINTEARRTLPEWNKVHEAVQSINIMDRNPTAHTCEWHDDSVETLSNPSNEFQRSSQKEREVPVVKLPGKREFAGRRIKKKWSSEEEETLRKAVQRYGAGNWTFIKSCYSETFEDRTAGDLKDKWRNMTR